MQPISEQIRRLWSLRLSEEHRNLCWQYGLNLRKPLIEIIFSARIWGRFLSSGCTIQISERLIRLHSWDVVLQVLKHEMAHQAVIELYKTPDGHGRLFRQVADRLGLEPRFARASGDLPRTIATAVGQNQPSGSLHRRVVKLLHLASSDNPHEAKLALEKAGMLIARYNLRFLSEGSESKYSYRIIDLERKNISAAHRHICSLLRRFFFVEVVLSSLYDARVLKSHLTVELLGRIENIDTAEYVFHFLEHRLQHLWETHRRRTKAGAGKRKAYQLGILDGFALQLEKRLAGVKRAVSASDQSAIIVSQQIINDPTLQHLVSRRHPKLRRGRTASCWLDQESFAAGKSKGERLSFFRPITAKTAAGCGVALLSQEKK